ncbi:MAG: hypothetical protein ACRD1I_07125 [Terriglobia bacterium]
MKHHMKSILFLSLTVLLMEWMAIVPLGAAHRADIANWNNLKQLAPGAEIKIVLNNKKSYRGSFQSVSDEAIVVRLRKIAQTFSRQEVFRVSTKGKSHRLRNTLIGAGVGAGAGFAFGAAADAGDFSFHFASGNSGKEIFIPSFAVVGAIVGAALPARRWRSLYRAR